jgi:MATE family multidrug resistance protein
MINDLAAVAPQPITHRRVLKIAIPIMLSNVTVPLMGLVDVFTIGQTPEATPLAAVSLGVVVISTLYWVFGFLRMGTTGLVGQAVGAGDDIEVATLLSRALLISAAAGLTLILVQTPIFSLAAYWSDASEDAEALMLQYMGVRIWSAPAAIAVFALTGWLIAMERTGGVFAVQFVMNGLNIVLSLWFVLGLGWGVPGAALASVAGELAGAGLGLWLCRSNFTNSAAWTFARVFDKVKLASMMSVNRDILIRSLLLMTIFSSLPFLASPFGDTVVAANAVLLQFLHIIGHALDGFAFAAEALVARAFGRRDRARLRRSAILTSVWGAAACLTFAVFFALAGPWLISLLTVDVTVQATATTYLPWMVAMPILVLGPFMLDGIFIGATRARDMRNMMVISALVFWVLVLAALPHWGNHGLWAALSASLIARGLTMAARYPALERAAES